MLKYPEKPLVFSGFYYLRQPLCFEGGSKNKSAKRPIGTIIDSAWIVIVETRKTRRVYNEDVASNHRGSGCFHQALSWIICVELDNLLRMSIDFIYKDPERNHLAGVNY